MVSSDKQNELKHLIDNTPAGEIVFIDVVPLYIAVSLKPTNAQLQKNWPVHLTLNPPEIVLPIGLRSKYTDVDVFLDFDAAKKEKNKGETSQTSCHFKFCCNSAQIPRPD